MTDDDPVLAYCERELETYRRLLVEYKTGRRKIGDSSDGRTWTDTTPRQITFLEAKIDELREILKARPG